MSSSSSSPNRICRVCASQSDLYLTSCCRKMVICLACAKSMALKKEVCADCGMVFERVVREYDVRWASSSENKKYICLEYEDAIRAPDFSKNNKWALQKADPTLALEQQSSFVLKNSTGGEQYEGRRVAANPNYVNMLLFPNHDTWTIDAVPSEAFFKSKKLSTTAVDATKQPTLEEAEIMMRNRERKVAQSARRMNLRDIDKVHESSSSSSDEGKADGLDYEEKFSDDDIDMGEEKEEQKKVKEEQKKEEEEQKKEEEKKA